MDRLCWRTDVTLRLYTISKHQADAARDFIALQIGFRLRRSRQSRQLPPASDREEAETVTDEGHKRSSLDVTRLIFN